MDRLRVLLGLSAVLLVACSNSATVSQVPASATTAPTATTTGTPAPTVAPSTAPSAPAASPTPSRGRRGRRRSAGDRPRPAGLRPGQARAPPRPPPRLWRFGPGHRVGAPYRRCGGAARLPLRRAGGDPRFDGEPVLERDRRLLRFRWSRGRRRDLSRGRHQGDRDEVRGRPQAHRRRRSFERGVHELRDGLHPRRHDRRDRQPGRRDLQGPGGLHAEDSRRGPRDPWHDRRHDLLRWRGDHAARRPLDGGVPRRTSDRGDVGEVRRLQDVSSTWTSMSTSMPRWVPPPRRPRRP